MENGTVSTPRKRKNEKQTIRRRTTLMEIEKNLEELLVNFRDLFVDFPPQLKEVIGMVSHAVGYEKTGTPKIEDVEATWARASASLFSITRNDELMENEDVAYWLRLMDLQVNSRLREIVALADSNSKKTPLYFEKLEEENKQLKQDIKMMRNYVDEVKSELEVYKQPDIIDLVDTNILNETTIEDIQNQEKEILEQSSDNIVVDEIDEEAYLQQTKEMIRKGKSIREKLDKASNIVEEIQELDNRILRTFHNDNFLSRLYQQHKEKFKEEDKDVTS